jgi:hypothetical protein
MKLFDRAPMTATAHAVAFHAAGHAVVAHLVGLRAQSVSVLSPCNLHGRGHGPLGRSDFDAHAVAVLGGAVAESAISGTPVEVILHRGMGHDDLDTLTADIRYVFLPDERADAFLRAVEDAVAIVTQPGVWPTIVTVAGLLLSNGVVSEMELVAVLAIFTGPERQVALTSQPTSTGQPEAR